MRKSSAALAALALSAVALTGCSSAPTFAGETCDRTGSARGIDQDVTVSGEVGEEPDLSLLGPLKVQKASFYDAVVGDGEAVVDPNQVMLGAFTLYSGVTGEAFNTTGYDQARGMTITTIGQSLPGFDKVLECVTGGSRVVAAIPTTELDEQTLMALGLTKEDSIIGVFDIEDTMLSRAEGDRAFNNARGLPTVVRAPDGRPGIIIPDSDAPKKTVVQTLIVGKGDKVGGDPVMYNSTAVGWDDKTVISSNWGQTPSSDVSTLPEDVISALQDATVGSQLLVVVPGEGDEQAVAYVIDVLGTLPTGQ